MKKVLHVTWELSTGGIEALLMNLYRNMDRDRIQFDILSEGENGFLYGEELKRLGGQVHIVPLSENEAEYSRRLAAFFEEHHDYEVLHVHLPRFGWMFMEYAKRYGIEKQYVHFHDAKKKKKNVLKRLREYAATWRVDRKLMGRATGVFVCSERMAQYHRTQQMGKGKTYFLKNGVDSRRFQFQPEVRAAVREEMNLEGRYVLICPARLAEVKNHAFLIDVVEEMRRRDASTILLLAGVGPLEEDLKAKVHRLGLDECVQFLGARNDVHRLMQAADALVMPSYAEGLSVAYIEGQAAGMRVYTSEEALAEEAVITDLISAKPLSAGAASWAEWILQGKGYERQDTLPDLVKSGFSIEETAHRLQQLYLGEKSAEELFERV